MLIIKSDNKMEKGVDNNQIIRRSFSFSSLDFNSSFGRLSTDEDEAVYSDDNDNDSYIEIDLDHPRDHENEVVIAGDVEQKKNSNNNDNNSNNDDLEFRVSFPEAALPFIGLSSPRSSSCSSTTVAPKHRKMPLFFPVNHLINTLEEGSPPGDDSISVGDHRRCSADSKHHQLVLSMSRKGTSGGMTNVMVKFRYVMSFRWMVTSMWKFRRQHRHVVTSPPSITSSSSLSSRPSAASDNSSNHNQLLTRRQRRDQSRQHRIVPKAEKSRQSSSSVLLLRLGINLRGMVASSDNGGVGKQPKSCPGSIKSSPVHHQGIVATVATSSNNKQDNSVHAAIAHCKKSFGRSEDFSFY